MPYRADTGSPATRQAPQLIDRLSNPLPDRRPESITRRTFSFPGKLMFSKKKSAGIQRTKLATLIGHDVRITGDLLFSDGLRMDGHVRGNVGGAPDSQTLLVLSDRGSIEGNVHGYDVVVNGRIVGDVIADHFVELQSHAHVTGNIYY